MSQPDRGYFSRGRLATGSNACPVMSREPALAVPVESGRFPAGLLSMIRKLRSGEYRLYSRKVNPKTGKRRNLGTFKSRAAAEKHERDVQYFKRH